MIFHKVQRSGITTHTGTPPHGKMPLFLLAVKNTAGLMFSMLHIDFLKFCGQTKQILRLIHHIQPIYHYIIRNLKFPVIMSSRATTLRHIMSALSFGTVETASHTPTGTTKRTARRTEGSGHFYTAS